MNFKIAEEIMGWRQNYVKANGHTYMHFIDENGEKRFVSKEENFMTNLNAAQLVINKMREKGFCVEILIPITSPPTVTMSRVWGTDKVKIRDESLCVAICKAALKANSL